MPQIEFDIAHNMARLVQLAARYRDHMSEPHPKCIVITTDQKDFRVYRRNKREAIPILCPPRRM